MHQWLDSWVGLGLIVDGMARQGFGAPFLRKHVLEPLGQRLDFERLREVAARARI